MILPIDADTQKATDRMTKARMKLILDKRLIFFGALALRLKMQVAPWCKTAATDGVKLYYAPAYINSLTDDQVLGLIVHEVLHCSAGHIWRKETRDHKLFNVACDFAIDPIIQKAGLTVPDPTINPAWDALSAEQIYAVLAEQQRAEQEKQKKEREAAAKRQQEEQAGKESDDGQPQPGDAPASDGEEGGGDKPGSGKGKGDGEADDGDGSGDGSGDGEPSEGEGSGSGSGSPGDGSGEPTDPRAPDGEPTKGQIIDPQNVNPAEEEAKWRIAVVQAANVAKSQGNLPAGVERLVEEFIEPKIDWKSVLRRFVQNLAALDYSWRQPSSRYMAAGLYLPKLQSESMPPIVVGIDTSGSIGQEELKVFTSEVSSIIEEVCPEMTYVLFCDAAIANVQEFMPGDPIEYKPGGGGGTNMVKIFDWIEENSIEPACCIVLTDMYTPFGEEQSYPVLWASSTKTIVAPHGETLYIGE